MTYNQLSKLQETIIDQLRPMTDETKPQNIFVWPDDDLYFDYTGHFCLTPLMITDTIRHIHGLEFLHILPKKGLEEMFRLAEQQRQLIENIELEGKTVLWLTPELTPVIQGEWYKPIYRRSGIAISEWPVWKARKLNQYNLLELEDEDGSGMTIDPEECWFVPPGTAAGIIPQF
jgi:hypothetical protein